MAYVIVGVTASRRRGKKFLGPLPESLQNAGVPTAGAITALEEFRDGYLATFSSGGQDYTPGVCKPDGLDFVPFVAARIDLLLGTQRRRKPGVGA
jgi:hypothetical protein